MHGPAILLLVAAALALGAACASTDALAPSPVTADYDDAAVTPAAPATVDPYAPPRGPVAQGDTSTAFDDDAPDGPTPFQSDAAVAADADGTGDDAPGPPFDPGEAGVCSTPLSPGDVVIDEMMIESVAGTGDHGEWVEVASTLPCALDVRGLRGDVPSGSAVRTFTIDDDLWLPSYGTFVVADSSRSATNHDLPGSVVTWSGQPGDVLRNKGSTITLRENGQIIDSVTYPALSLAVGTSVSFPSDCAPARRADLNAWQRSTSSWFPAFYGTPNAPNTDVHCPP